MKTILSLLVSLLLCKVVVAAQPLTLSVDQIKKIRLTEEIFLRSRGLDGIMNRERSIETITLDFKPRSLSKEIDSNDAPAVFLEFHKDKRNLFSVKNNANFLAECDAFLDAMIASRTWDKGDYPIGIVHPVYPPGSYPDGYRFFNSEESSSNLAKQNLDRVTEKIGNLFSISQIQEYYRAFNIEIEYSVYNTRLEEFVTRRWAAVRENGVCKVWGRSIYATIAVSGMKKKGGTLPPPPVAQTPPKRDLDDGIVLQVKRTDTPSAPPPPVRREVRVNRPEAPVLESEPCTSKGCVVQEDGPLTEAGKRNLQRQAEYQAKLAEAERVQAAERAAADADYARQQQEYQAALDRQKARQEAHKAEVKAREAAHQAKLREHRAEIARQNAAHEANMAAWRKRVDACLAGDKSQCQQ